MQQSLFFPDILLISYVLAYDISDITELASRKSRVNAQTNVWRGVG
jgi:hypothetical protein